MAKDTNEPTLFDEEGGIEENWREEWKGMPGMELKNLQELEI